MSPDPPFDLLCQSCGVRSPSASSATAAAPAREEETAATRVVHGDGEIIPAGDPPQDDRGSQVGWHVLLFLLGVEAALPLLWPTSVLPAFLPVVTVVVALRLGWIDRRPEVVRWLVGLALVGLALVGSVLLALSLLPDADVFKLWPLVATCVAMPALIAAAAGLLGGLRSRAGRACLLFVGGAVLGFVVPVGTLIELRIDYLGHSLTAEGIEFLSVFAPLVAEAILVCFVLPALGAGIVLGHRIRDRSRSGAIG